MKKTSIFSIVLYAIGGIFGGFSIWALVKSVLYINQLIAAGQLAAKDSFYDIVSFFVSSVGQYIVFALILIAAGIIIQKLLDIKNDLNETIEIEDFSIDLGSLPSETASESISSDLEETADEI